MTPEQPASEVAGGDVLLSAYFDPQEPSKIRSVPLDVFLGIEFPPRPKILHPWLDAQGLYMLHSVRGVGKTMLGLHLAYAITSGGSLFSWTVPKPSGVLYVDGEMPAVVLQERLARIASSVDYECQVPLRIITPDLQRFGIPDLTKTEGQEAINEHIDDSIALVILDNLSALCRTGEENSAESWQPMQTWALELRRRGKSVLFMHHSGKTGLQRGTSRREDVLDAVIKLRRPAKYSQQDGCVFELHFEKTRGLYGKAFAPFEARLTETPDGRWMWATRSLEDSTRECALQMLDDGMRQSDVAHELGIHRSTVCRYAKYRNR